MHEQQPHTTGGWQPAGPQAFGGHPGGYGPHPAPVPPPARSTSLRWIIAGGLAAAVFIAALVVVFAVKVLGGGGPGDAVEDYIEAAKRDDRAAMTDSFCARLREQIVSEGGSVYDRESASGDFVDAKVTSVEESGSTAEVTIESTSRRAGRSAVTTSVVIVLVKEDGDWRICGSRPAGG